MKEILLIHHRLPYPLTNGMDKLRFNLLITLSKRYKVTLAVPVCGYINPEWISKLMSFVELITVPVSNKYSIHGNFRRLYLYRLIQLFFFHNPGASYENYYKEFKNRVVNLVNERNFFFVQILSDYSACYLPYLPAKAFKITGPMDDSIELTSQSYLLETEKIPKLGLKFLKISMERYFFMICKKSNLVLFHSGEDLNRVKSVLGFDFNARILPVATESVESAEFPSDDKETNSLIFVGGFGAKFNQDAAMHLVKDILPIIKTKIPTVKLYLVGNSPSNAIKALNNNDIIVTGEVEDVKPYIRKTQVYVSSVRMGTGIKTKLIEALSMSKAIVASSPSLRGLWEIDDSIIFCDEEADFAENVIKLLQNSELRRKYEKRSGALYDRAYAPSKVEHLTIECYRDFEKMIQGFRGHD